MLVRAGGLYKFYGGQPLKTMVDGARLVRAELRGEGAPSVDDQVPAGVAT